MSLSKALDDILNESEKVIASEAIGLHTDLLVLSSGAMKKTGHFNRSFDIRRKGKMKWTISNSADYASILANGRRLVGGRYYGSVSWQGGLSPMLEKTNNDITRRLDKIRK